MTKPLPPDQILAKGRQEDLRRAFAAMGGFYIRKCGKNSWGIFTESGLHVGRVYKGKGNYLYRTLEVLSTHGRKRMLRSLPLAGVGRPKGIPDAPAPIPIASVVDRAAAG